MEPKGTNREEKLENRNQDNHFGCEDVEWLMIPVVDLMPPVDVFQGNAVLARYSSRNFRPPTSLNSRLCFSCFLDVCAFAC
jgi:hypothetical protein